MSDDPLFEVLRALDEVGLRFHVGGSYASSVHGVPRLGVADLLARALAEA